LIIRIPSAIDKLVELGITDNNRVGVFGQSFGGYFQSAILVQNAQYSGISLVIYRVRSTIFALACVASAFAILAAIWLAEGLHKGGQMLADWVATHWSGEQIEAVMEYAMPASLALIALSLNLIFASAMSAKKE
jgi:hypothetical protein